MSSTLSRRPSFIQRKNSMLTHVKSTNRRGFAEENSKRLRRVLIFYTGGTIGMMPSSRGYVPKSGYLPKLLESLPMFHDKDYDLSNEILPTIVPTSNDDEKEENKSSTTTTTATNDTITSTETLPHLSPTATYDLTLDSQTPRRLNKNQASSSISSPLVTPVSEYGRRTLYYINEYNPLLDSCNISSIDWSMLAKDIKNNYSEFDAFIILHGTDTMAYTASALSFMLDNVCKTIVITGSQIPLVRPRNDGVSNLLGALAITGHYDIPEVLLFFGSKMLRGNRTSKIDCTFI
jgi:lysophospholipase